MEKYNPKKIEQKWQRKWEEMPELYHAQDQSEKEKRYILDMFPYPSGEGLHTGHVESYTATDIISRYLRMNDKNVLRPQGWDAFGLPAENYAIKTKIHPAQTTQKAIKNFKAQMKMMGFSYDWSREINTSSPEYYKWTQWFFLLLYKNKLAYREKAKVNWCESCQTVLANEQVENGVCERCSNKVVQKEMEQWFFKITDFIEDKEKTAGLINGLQKDDWPPSTKLAQINWIGKSLGVQFKMPVENSDKFVEVYTTRIDTVFGMTYAVVAPEHPIISELKEKIENWEEVEKYLEDAKKKTDLDRIEAKTKTGVEIKGVKIINPFNNKKIPLFVADYVLIQYGAGAVMAVPAHDERDYEFAKSHNLDIKYVIEPDYNNLDFKEIHLDFAIADREGSTYEENLIKTLGYQYSIIKNGQQPNFCFTGDGILINSEEFDGLTSKEAQRKMTKWLEEKGIGKKKVNYKLRDWLVSRQRYWGAPIPIIYCQKCGEVPVPEKDLPVELPEDIDFLPTGKSPLERSKKFQNVKCPRCGGGARRESDTMDTFVCSSWYYFRYADPKNAKEFASKEKIKKWLPVDLYIGGAEHTVLHLLYSRFFTKALHYLGHIDFDEPFLKLRHQGIILAEDGRKMSKSLGNVINPDDVVKEFGADSLRMFEMFMGPLEDMKPWNTQGIIGLKRFLEKIWKFSNQADFSENSSPKINAVLNKTIKKVTEDIESLRFNTAISAMMIFVNELEKEKEISKTLYSKFLIILSPFAPHIAEELWEKLGNNQSIFLEKWPAYDPQLIQDEEIELVIQVNGKLRDRVKVPKDISEDEAKKMATESEKVKKIIAGKEVKKIIFVKGKLINIVI